VNNKKTKEENYVRTCLQFVKHSRTAPLLRGFLPYHWIITSSSWSSL